MRFVGLRYGLPFGGLLNPDELNVVPRAWRMTHGGGPDPHWFEWPTLVMYLQAPFQAIYGVSGRASVPPTGETKRVQ